MTGKERKGGRQWDVEIKDNRDVKSNSSFAFVFWLYSESLCWSDLQYLHYFSTLRRLCQNMSRLNRRFQSEHTSKRLYSAMCEEMKL